MNVSTVRRHHIQPVQCHLYPYILLEQNLHIETILASFIQSICLVSVRPSTHTPKYLPTKLASGLHNYMQWNLFILAPLGSVESHLTYTGGKLRETNWLCEKWAVWYSLYKSAVQSEERGGRVGKQVHKPSQWLGNSDKIMGHLPPRKSNMLWIFVEKRWSLSGQQVIVLVNENLWIMHSRIW